MCWASSHIRTDGLILGINWVIDGMGRGECHELTL